MSRVEPLPPLEEDDPTTIVENSAILKDAINKAVREDPTRFTTRSFAVLWNKGHSMRLISRTVPWFEVWKGDVLYARVNATYVGEVYYQEGQIR